jgi:hypothetical protein
MEQRIEKSAAGTSDGAPFFGDREQQEKADEQKEQIDKTQAKGQKRLHADSFDDAKE